MKLLALLILTYLSLICGCNRYVETDNTFKKTIITGKVVNRDVYPDYKTVTINIGDFRGWDISYVDTIKEDGTFRVELDLFVTQDIGFDPIVGTLLVRPGDSIFVNIDFNNIGHVDFSGDFAKANYDFQKYVNSYYSVDYYRRAKYPMDDVSFLMFCDSVREVMYAKQTEYINKVNPEKEVASWIRNSIDVRYSIEILIHAMRNLEKTENKEEQFPQEMSKMEYLFNDSLTSSNAHYLIWLLLGKETLKHFGDSTLTKEFAMQNVLTDINHKYPNELFKQWLIGTLFQMDLQNNNVDFYENNSHFFTNHIPQSFISKPLAILYDHLKYHVDHPQIRHNEILRLLEDTPGRALLDSILKAHKGKVIYIDFWATWCAPCIAALPSANRMIKKYENDNIEFVFLCLGSFRNQWEELVNSLDMKGFHHYSKSNEEIGSLMRGFQIRGLPFYALVNQDGIIVDTGYHLGPMTHETLNKINVLKQKAS
jgi:thiol-disulfide isomerase/thioredoxin